MATQEVVTILRVDTGEAVRNIGDLKANIKAYKSELEGLTIGSEEYQSVLAKLEESQYALKTAMHATSSGIEEVTAAAQGAGESYNALVKRMADLREQLKAVDVSTEEGKEKFGALAEEINATNDRLKEMDAMQGNYQRNVGNYKSALDGLKSGFKGLATSSLAAIAPSKGLTVALQALSATPVVAILGLIAMVLTTIINAMKKSEAATASLNKVMDSFSIITDAINTILQYLGQAIAWVTEKSLALIGAIFGLRDAQEARNSITMRELELAERQRDALVKDANANLAIAKLKAEAADKEKNTAEQRLGYLQQAADKEKEIAQRSYEDLKLAYEIQRDKNALAASTAEEKEKEAQAYADMVNAYTAYYNKVKELNAQMSEAKKQIASDAKAAASAAISARKEQLTKEKELLALSLDNVKKYTNEEWELRKKKAEKEHEMTVNTAKTTIKNRQTLNATLRELERKHAREMREITRKMNDDVLSQTYQHYANLANQYSQNSRKYLEEMMNLRKKQMDDIIKGGQKETETLTDYNVRRLAAQKAYYEAEAALRAKQVAQTMEQYTLMQAQAKGNEEKMLEVAVATAQRTKELVTKLAGETEVAYQTRLQQAQNALNEALDAQANWEVEQARLKWENKVEVEREGTRQQMQMMEQFAKWELDNIINKGQLATETEAEYQSRRIAAEKKYTASKKALIGQQIADIEASVSGVSSLLSSIADAYEAFGEDDEAMQEKAKALRIAGATIDTISGAITAYMKCQELGQPWGTIIGAIQAATVTATGIANIAKIKNTDVSGSSSSTTTASFASTTAPTVQTTTPAVSVVSNSADAVLNQIAQGSQKVYILQSDIEAANKVSKVHVSESTFV